MLSRSDLHGLRNMDERLCPYFGATGNCTKMRDSLEAQRLASLLISCSVTAGTHKDAARFGFGQGLFNRWLPWIAWNQMPFVQPSLYSFLGEPAS
jgi:hypothetical protein